MTNSITAVVVCAGSSTRMRGIDKIFSAVNGIPVIAHTLIACDKSRCITDMVVVTKPENYSKILSITKTYAVKKKVSVTCGGSTRALSALNGVKAAGGKYAAITDGARPLVSSFDIDNTCIAAQKYGAAALGVKMTDTVKRENADGFITETVDRSDLIRIQTPQVFLKDEYIRLAQKALESDFEFTDDCSIYEYFGKQVKIVTGSNYNIKITEREDLDMASRLCTSLPRTGHGYDVHRLVSDRALVLCGVNIDFELGLLGHSDADVALHALMDAMLGAAGMGDIGTLFPDTSSEFKDISSLVLLKRTADRVFCEYSFGNCDITIIAQKPKLLPYISKMRANIANTLSVSEDTVNIKATTEEKLGFTGSLEGISAHAVCTLYKKGIL